MEICVLRTEGSALLEVQGAIREEDIPLLLGKLECLDTKELSQLVIHFEGATHLEPEILDALIALFRRLPPDCAVDVIARSSTLRQLFQTSSLSGGRRMRVLSHPAEVFAA